MYSDAQYVRSALDAGVSGYILKSALETDLTRAVRAVAAGQQYLSPELSHVLIRALREKQDAPEAKVDENSADRELDLADIPQA